MLLRGSLRECSNVMNVLSRWAFVFRVYNSKFVKLVIICEMIYNLWRHFGSDYRMSVRKWSPGLSRTGAAAASPLMASGYTAFHALLFIWGVHHSCLIRQRIYWILLLFITILADCVKFSILNQHIVSLGGLGVTCSPRDLRFAGSNPAEVDGFFSGRKNPEHKSSGVPSLRFQAR